MRKILLFCLCAFSAIVANAQFSGAGSGTSEDPYQITNADELSEMAYFLGDTHKGTHFKLMNNIDLSQWIEENNPTAGWNPIGVPSDRFKSTFDGDNKTISGLYINRPNVEYIGLFGYVESATISNLIIEGSSVTGNNQTGGLIGEAASSTKISNCRLSLNGENGVSGKENVGGLVGCYYSSTMTNCEYNGKVNGKLNGNTGGLIGRAENCTINESVASASIYGIGSVGGIIGCSANSLSCSGCKHRGSINGETNLGGIVGYLHAYSSNTNISSCSHNGDINGTENIGGIVGSCYYRYTTYTTLITNCFSSGQYTGTNYLGGILGKENYYNNGYNNNIHITNSYAFATIIGEQNIGGIVGDKQCNGEIKYNYFYGTLAGTSNIGGIVGNLSRGSVYSNCAIETALSASSNYGRIVGYKGGGTIGAIRSQQGNRAYSKCVVSVDGAELTVGENERNGTSVSLAALKNPNTYIGIGWDFDETWTINNGKTFPYLQWEKRVNAIALSKSEANMSVGETSVIEATVTPLDADLKDLNWTSSDESIATVANGTITAIAEGTATITATAKDGSEISATCVVTVSNIKDSDPSDFDNVVYMQSFAAELGDEVDLPILLKNKTDGDITGFDFYLYLPEGVSPVVDEDGFPIITITAGRTTTRKHSIFADIESNGSIHVYTTATRATYTFSGTTGEVASMALKVANDAPNGVHQVVLRNIEITSLSEEDPFSVLRFNFSASIGKLSFDVSDGESLVIAQNKTYDEVNYSRTFSSANKWQALYVPFSIPVETLTANGLEVAELNNVHMYDTDENGSFDKTTLEFLYLKSGATQANYPYLIKSANAGEVTMTFTNAELKAATETQIECATTRQVFKIKGTYTGVSGSVMYNNNYYAMGGGSLVRVENAESGLKPQRWYLSIENKNGSPVEYYAPTVRIMIDGFEIDPYEEYETGIHEISTKTESEGTIYSLDGSAMTQSRALKSGIYIKNHQKMIVR